MTESRPALVNPGSRLDWAWDWSAWLNTGDSIQSHEIQLPAGLSLVGGSDVVDGVVVGKIEVAADMALGTTVAAKCVVTTVAGLVDSRSIWMRTVSR